MSHASSTSRLAVVGAGAWGTVLALLLAVNGNDVALYTRRESHARAMQRDRENRERLPGVVLPSGLVVTGDLDEASDGAEAAFIAVPSRAVADTVRRLPPLGALVSCAKGLARPGLRRLSEVIAEAAPRVPLAVLSGPNLASEIAAGLPAAAVAAADRPELATKVQHWLQSPSFRVYSSPDPAGAEVGGALKNVIALAAGMCDGLGLGENAKAGIVTRGLAEIVRLGVELGGRRETLYGLAGLGDLVATCSSHHSRNHQAGLRIAQGATIAALEREQLTAEGIPTVAAVYRYATEQSLSLPISTEVYRVAFEQKDPRAAIGDLMARTPRSEW